jgi:hypothetical protein
MIISMQKEEQNSDKIYQPFMIKVQSKLQM